MNWPAGPGCFFIKLKNIIRYENFELLKNATYRNSFSSAAFLNFFATSMNFLQLSYFCVRISYKLSKLEIRNRPQNFHIFLTFNPHYSFQNEQPIV